MPSFFSNSRKMFAVMVWVFGSCATTADSSRQSPPSELLPAETDAMAPASPAPALAPAPPAVLPSPPACDMFAKPGVLKRAALVGLLDAGLPRWLQSVEGDRALAKHRFQGWLVKSLHPGDPCYRNVDLRAGDIVQKVNGKSIEKP